MPTFAPTLAFEIRPRAPYRLDLTVAAARRRDVNPLDRWKDGALRRTLEVDGAAREVTVRQEGSAEDPLLLVEVDGSVRPEQLPTVRAALDRLLGTRVDMAPFASWAAANPDRAELAARFRGMRPPRTPTVFETLAFAICCQQLTLARGLVLVGRLVAEAGTPRFAGDPYPAFPTPQAVATVPTERWTELGFSRMKARALAEASRGIAAGELDLEALDDDPDDAVRERLGGLYGVGRWTSDVVLLRGLGRLHVFPRGDSGALGGLARWAGLGRRPDRSTVDAIIDDWRPYGGLLYLHLLLDGLRARGDLPT
jgi:DNA-3-methyladenine glycosylase II